jgi:hypothetical protein
VEFGLGYLVGRPNDAPQPARSVDALLAGPGRPTRSPDGHRMAAAGGGRIGSPTRGGVVARVPVSR